MKTKPILIFTALMLGCSLLLQAQKTPGKTNQPKNPAGAVKVQSIDENLVPPPPPPPPPVPDAPPPASGPDDPPPPPPPSSRELQGIPDLTKEQAESISKLHLEMLQKMMALENELREKEARMRTLTTVESPDMKAITQVIEETGDLQTRIMKLKVANDLDIRKMLTPEQRLIFDRRPRPMHQEHR